MPIDPRLIPELVNKAKSLKYRAELRGEKNCIEKYTVFPDACGCMGPSEGNFLCSCAQNEAIRENMVEVVSHVDQEEARKIMLQHIVSALPG